MPTEEQDQKNPPGAGSGSGANPSGTDAPDDVGGDEQDLSTEDLAKLPEWVRLKLGKQGRENSQLRGELRKKEQAEAEQAAKAKQAEDERLAKQGEFQKLAEQRAQEIETLKAKADRAAALEARIKADNDARIKAIPENLRSLVPKYSDPVEMAEWLRENHDKVVKANPAPKLDGGKRGEGTARPKNSGKKTPGLRF